MTYLVLDSITGAVMAGPIVGFDAATAIADTWVRATGSPHHVRAVTGVAS